MSINLKSLKKECESFFRSKGDLYLANLLAYCDIQERPNQEGLACITPDKYPTIYLSKDFSTLSRLEQVAVIAHEVSHIPQIKILNLIRPLYDYTKAQDKLEGDRLLEFMNRDSKMFKQWRAKVENLGMDAEINQDLKKKYYTLPEGLVYPNNLNKFCDSKTPPPKQGLEFLYYNQYCVDELDIPEEDQDSQGGGDSNVNPEDWEEILDPILEGALDKTIEDIKEGKTQSKSDAEKAKQVGDSVGIDMMKIKPNRVPYHIEVKLKEVKRKLKPIRGVKNIPTYTWSRRHKAFPGKQFPDLKTTPFIKRTEKVVVVLDTSGSCWDEDNFNLGVGVAKWFDDLGLLADFYCCDTKLRRVGVNKKFRSVSGGGGTSFTRSHVDAIIKDVGEDISILYLTDGELDLTDANSRKDTHVMVIF